MKAVFLDRDGTVNLEHGDGRVNSVDVVKLLPNALEALRLLATLNYEVFFVTNQLGIAEGLITVEGFNAINQRVLDLIKPSGIKISKTYFCPHQPSDNCECRKPKPGMLLQAAEKFDVDLQASYFVGDRLTDIEAGNAAGTKTILVQTGNPPIMTSDEATYVATDLLEAVRYIASQEA